MDNENETHHHSHETIGGSDVFTAKAITMVVLCLVSICMGLIPIQVGRCVTGSGKVKNPKSSKYVGMLLGFGGGVLFATTFLHMLPEVSENVKEYVEHNSDWKQIGHYPITEFLICIGFFIMYLVEEIIHTRLRNHQANSIDHLDKDVNRSTNELVENGQVSHSTMGHTGCGHGHSHLPAGALDDSHDFVTTSLRGLLIVFGLSVHELFEGLSVGLESTAENVWLMFFAVAVHKFVIAFCIGVELIVARTNHWLSVIYVCTFAVVSPMGIGIGMFLVQDHEITHKALPVILQGLATGTLLYVVFFEILQHHRDGLHQYLSILIGFLVMFGLQLPTSCILGVGSLLLGMLPLVVGRCQLRKRQKCGLSTTSSTSTNTSSTIDTTAQQGLLTSLLLCFGGGVLLFTTFLHLAPEVRHSVESHQAKGQLFTLGTLSMPELLFCIGFFLVYLVEETVHATITGKVESSEDLLYRTVSVRRTNKRTPTSASNTTITTVTTSNRKTLPNTWKAGKFRYEDEDDRISQESTINQKEVVKEENGFPVVFVRPPPPMEPAINAGLEGDRFVAPQTSFSKPQKPHNHTDTSARGLLAVVALSFHAIFEGLAVGLEPSIGSVLYLAGAIATHKLVIAFCVGMELYVAGASTKTVLGYMSVFSMVTPLGIMAGLALGYLKNDSENLGATPTILQGIATGTLLYVVFFEVLGRERANEKSGLLQLIAIIAGFSLMLALQLATAHSHSHGHENGHEQSTGIKAY